MKILLVDDSQEICARLRGLIADIPGAVVVDEAANADDAIAKIRALQPDVVILDINLAYGTGMDVMRSTRGLSPMQVIVLTNYAGYTQYRNKFLELGANYFLDKSKDISKLEQTLRELAETFKHNLTTSQRTGA